MTRIIAGTHGGRRLAVPPTGTRPTSDRVREAIFSRLHHLDALDGARVLDLFAGSGALGLEAASRGAARVVLVENNRRAAAVARQNAKTLGLDQVTVICDDAVRYLSTLADTPKPFTAGTAATAAPFDVVLADPPYDIDEAVVTDTLRHLVAPSLLASHAVVVLERSVRNPTPTLPATWDISQSKTYGDTVIYLLEPVACTP